MEALLPVVEPAAHARHDVAPLDGAKKPLLHGAHWPFPGELRYVPEKHAVQLEAPVADSVREPGVQTRQGPGPAIVENEPIGHGVQEPGSSEPEEGVVIEPVELHEMHAMYE